MTIFFIIFALFLLLITSYFIYEANYRKEREEEIRQGTVVHKYHTQQVQHQFFIDEIGGPGNELVFDVFEIIIDSKGELFEYDDKEAFDKVKMDQKVKFKVENIFKVHKKTGKRTLIGRKVISLL